MLLNEAHLQEGSA